MTHEAPNSSTTLVLSNGLYNVSKKAAQIWLPAVATLYFALSQIWGLGYAAEVVGTITSVDTFLGVLLGLSTASYNKSDLKYDGSVTITPNEDADTTNLKFNIDPAYIAGKGEALLKVNNPS